MYAPPATYPMPAPARWHAWMDSAVCAQVDLEVFFPEDGGSVRTAKRICQPCPVKAECLRFALKRNERFGVWGGLSERERRRIRDAGPE